MSAANSPALLRAWEINADFASLLRAAGVSRVWLAERTGWSRSRVDDWCAGDEPPAELVAWLQRRAEDMPPKRARRPLGAP